VRSQNCSVFGGISAGASLFPIGCKFRMQKLPDMPAKYKDFSQLTSDGRRGLSEAPDLLVIPPERRPRLH
jgi:hypothetical protein